MIAPGTSAPRSVRVREAVEADAAGIRDVFRSAYGRDYLYPDFYDESSLRRMVVGDDALMLVAEEEAGEIVGTASVVFDIGAYSDLIGEFGRLVVRPESRGRGVGTRLMEERIERVGDRLHVGIVEARVCDPFSVRISQKSGFAAVGFLPMKLRFGERRESGALLVRHFGAALELRRNHPRIIPEADRVASEAMENVGLTPDHILDEESAPYPGGGTYAVQEMTTEGYSELLRIERGRVRRREIFGPLRLHYGVFRLRSQDSSYLIARDEDGRIAGAVGYAWDRLEDHVRVFELIAPRDDAVRFVFRELERRARDDLGVVTIEIDVSAHATRMQRTLLELGFVPAGYVPAMAFHEVERLDIVKMYRVLPALDPGPIDVAEPARSMCRIVLGAFERREVAPRIDAAIDRVDLFEDLTPEQARRVARLCVPTRFADGTRIFAPGEEPDEMWLVLDGRVSIVVPGRGEVGQVAPGECVGEVALLTGEPHTADAIAEGEVEAAGIHRDELLGLVRRRPDIGVVVYRNLALGLGAKLWRADRVDPGSRSSTEP